MEVAVSTNRGTEIVPVPENPISLYEILEAAGVQNVDFDAVEVDGLRIGGFSKNNPEKRELRLKTFLVRCTDAIPFVRLLRRVVA